MKPNTLGGQTLEGIDEIAVVQESLLYLGDFNLLMAIESQIDTARQKVLRAHRELNPDEVSATMIRMLAEDDYDAMRIKYLPTLELNEKQTGLVREALRIAQKKHSPLSKEHKTQSKNLLKAIP